jgi:hypothetical protein
MRVIFIFIVFGAINAQWIFADEDRLEVFGIVQNDDSSELIAGNGAAFFSTGETIEKISTLEGMIKRSPPFEGYFILHIGKCDEIRWKRFEDSLKIKKIDKLKMMCYKDSVSSSETKTIAYSSKFKLDNWELGLIKKMEDRLDSISRVPNWVEKDRKRYMSPDKMIIPKGKVQSKGKNEIKQ